MSNLSIAFLLGFFGSVHCAVMCGPLMLSLPLSQKNYWNVAVQLLMYQLGRVSVYTFFGMLVGFIGSSIKLFTDQQTLSLIIGSLMIVFTLVHFSGNIKPISGFQTKLIAPISRMMVKVYAWSTWGLFAGMLNGLIPCGMIYLALASSLNSGSIREGASFMLLFGLGTTPLMLTISLGGIYLRRYIKFNANKLIPWFTLFIGVLFILRSANLGISFLSPDYQVGVQSEVAECK